MDIDPVCQTLVLEYNPIVLPTLKTLKAPLNCGQQVANMNARVCKSVMGPATLFNQGFNVESVDAARLLYQELQEGGKVQYLYIQEVAHQTRSLCEVARERITLQHLEM